MIVYALDIGGSYLKHALIEVSGRRAEIARRFEPCRLGSYRFADLRRAVTSSAQSVLREEKRLDTIAISTTGSVDRNGTVIRAGHFEDYENISWDQILRQEFPKITRVVTANDGKASTWAEFVAQGGSLNAFSHFVVGTGIGGGIVVRGELVYGDGGYAGYLGHIKVTDKSEVVCSCSRFGCVETVASAPAIVRLFEAKAGYRASNMTRAPMTLDQIAGAALEGDKIALEAFETAGGWLGVALSNVMNILNPATITIGGGVVLAAQHAVGQENGNIFIEAAIQKAKSLAHRRVAAETTIRAAQHGNDGGLIGAALQTVEPKQHW